MRCGVEAVVWSAATRPTASLGQGAAQGGGEFGDLPLRHLGRQDRVRPVEGAGPLVQLDRHAGLRASLSLLAIIALIALFASRWIPTQQPSAAPTSELAA